MTVNLSRLARTDLDEIWDYVALDALEAADDLLDSLFEAAHLLATQPRMGKPRFDLANEIRSFPVGQYLLFYRPLDGVRGIEIARVLHGRRDIGPELF